MIPVYHPPTSPDFVVPFWEAVARRALALPRCSVCGKWQWYPEVGGTDCAGGTLAWEDVALTGTVYSFTRVHRSFLPKLGRIDPYLVGLIDLDGVEGPRLVVSLDESALQIGRRVRARFETVGDRLHPIFEAEQTPG